MLLTLKSNQNKVGIKNPIANAFTMVIEINSSVLMFVEDVLKMTKTNTG